MIADTDESGSPDEQVGAGEPKTCFVVMPFGTKPRGPDKAPHDFDKVYRVVIKRAVEQAGMRCIRADETAGSRMIHTDMFRDLRDQPLVVADLSLQNANVFYELGIRHVMSSRGTVLMCERGSLPLPFDIGLSRVVMYDYDGTNLDWEEAERLVEQLRIALLESAAGSPDSPVHALLERVLAKDDDEPSSAGLATEADGAGERHDLEPYIAQVAATWRDGGTDLASLFDAHSDSRFGCSALGQRILMEEQLSPEWAPKIASQLNDLGEYALSARIYERLRDEGHARYDHLLRFANAHSESHPNIAGANRALAIVDEAMSLLEREFGDDLDSPDAIDARAYCLRRRAGLLQWRWQLSLEPGDLDAAIAAHGETIELTIRSRRLGTPWSGAFAGPLAQSHLKRLLLLRIRSGERDLDDPQRDIQGILEIKISPGDDRKSASYLRWYRTIALADSGAADRVHQSALDAFAKDADLMNAGAEYAEIGRRQYLQLRRFLEHYSKWLRHPELIGFIGQTLQARR